MNCLLRQMVRIEAIGAIDVQNHSIFTDSSAELHLRLDSDYIQLQILFQIFFLFPEKILHSRNFYATDSSLIERLISNAKGVNWWPKRANRWSKLVGPPGIEPGTSCTSSKRNNHYTMSP